MANDEVETTTGIGRRQVIKRGAVAAGVVWAAPAIQSFTNPAAAAAAGTPTPGGDCEEGQIMSVFVKYEVGGSFETATTDNPGTCISGGCAAANQWAADQMNAIATVVDSGDGEQVCITVPEDSVFLMIAAAAAKEGNACDDTPDAGSDPLPGGHTVCFSKDRIGGGVSNVTIELSACVPLDVAANC